ncbi:DUF1499 domain-containing protein [Anabaena sp. UHCC 0204]|uniref:DUF1499 domain-containing protein n=1 Tax=Anabaena sp. UHCC 0204 TaxID=2590009 RepID=UPI0014464C4A|nr:DUF1499 domain-containing protein [Anabaena sp. UHCC 0204]MTJ10280.1 DUF1499 domain-containing protein [Anabaena sp. UHCC 0204]
MLKISNGSAIAPFSVSITRLQNIIFSVFLTLIITLIVPASAWASSLGIESGHLSPCPASPNCVVSQNADAQHAIEPITYHIDRDKAREILLKVLTVVPRTEVIEQTDNYIHALSKSRIFKFVDDVEFYFPSDESVIHIRSSSRVGESDLGVNRTRVEQIRLALRDLNI